MLKSEQSILMWELHHRQSVKAGAHAEACVSKMHSNPNDFNMLLLDSIDEALLSLGEAARRSIYFHIEKNFLVPRDEIPFELEHFQMALEKIFGVGARYLEILIMRNLYCMVDSPLNLGKNDQLEFITYVEAAKQVFVEKCGNEKDC